METEVRTSQRQRSRLASIATRTDAEVVARRHAPVVLALWGLAVAQPLLDLFGQNPEFFLVNQFSRLEIVLFGLVVVFGVPAVLVLAELVGHAVDPRIGQGVHGASVAVLGAALALTVLGQFDVDDTAIVLLVSAFSGVLIAYLEIRVQAVATGLRYLALTPIVFIVAFLGLSPTAELVWGQEAAEISAGVVGRPGPIVVVSMDEFPLASLLGPDGRIDAERFPNFARLAGTSSWFRNATSVSPLTQQSVPATFTGRLPDDIALPTARDHPRSLYTLLGDGYDQFVEEQITDVCPDDLCPDPTGILALSRLRTSLLDAAVVYAQATMPPSVREHLPAVDRSWGGFIEGVNQEAATDPVAAEGGNGGAEDPGAVTADEPDPSCPDAELWCGAARFNDLIDHVEPAAGRPDLYAAHLTIPHVPWIRSPEGLQYAPRILEIPGTELDGSWATDEPFALRQSFQRHLLQVAYVDSLLGRLMDELEAAGQWDDAMVVVTADHGVSFTPGQPLRAPTPATIHEIYNVPLFIKVPGQGEGEGELRTDNALTVDVLPTIVDVLDIDTDWTFDGESLVGSGEHRPDKPVIFAGVRSVVPADFEGVLEVVRRNQTYVASGGGVSGILAVGAYADLVGRPVAQLDTVPTVGASWTANEAAALAAWDPDGGVLAPLLLHGRLVTPLVPTEALLVLNEVVAGVAGGFEPAGGELSFSALVDEQALRPGVNTAALLVPVAPGSRTFNTIPLSS